MMLVCMAVSDQSCSKLLPLPLTLLLPPPLLLLLCLQTRWYSFQFLMMELLMEIDELYHGIRKVLTTLPHGL
jgi:hypothetical protein